MIQAERRLTEDFPVAMDTSTVMVRAHGLPEALDQAARVARVLRHALGSGADVQTPSDWLVGGERLRVRMEILQRHDLVQAATLVERELQQAGFNVDAFDGTLARLRSLARGDAPQLTHSDFEVEGMHRIEATAISKARGCIAVQPQRLRRCVVQRSGAKVTSNARGCTAVQPPRLRRHGDAPQCSHSDFEGVGMHRSAATATSKTRGCTAVQPQ